MTELIQANLQLLKQGAELLAGLDGVEYVKASPVFLNSTIGGHFRHCLEHYQSLLRGLPNSQVDYDLRARDVQLETQPKQALALLNVLCAQLASLDGKNHPLDVRMDHGGSAENIQWQASSLGRELQFLISHTTHHFALIAGFCHLHGHTLQKDFGFAPSTLRHRAAMKA